MGSEEGRVVDNGRKQSGERPQKKGWEELGDDWILEDRPEKQDICVKNVNFNELDLNAIKANYLM